MAKTYELDTPFSINIPNNSNFWTSPNNKDPYYAQVASGDYNVSALYYDNSGVVWYRLDVPSSYGVACYIPATDNNISNFKSEKDAAAYFATMQSEEFRKYISERTIEDMEAVNESTDSASSASGISSQSSTSVSATHELITISDNEDTIETTEVFEYYVEKTRTTFGLPPQWNSAVDIQYRIPSTSMTVGRVYSQTIYANPTILSLTPGDIEMAKGNDTLFDILTGNSAMDLTESNIQEVVGANGSGESFFRFVDKWEEFIQFLNETNKFLTVALGASMSNTDIENDSRYFMDWYAPPAMFSNGSKRVKYRNIDFEDVLGSQRLIGGDPMHRHWLNFAISGQLNTQDSFSTSTRSTALENLINSSFSDTARDLYFMLGGKEASEAAKNDVSQVISEAVSELGSGFTGILTAAGDLLNGGHIEFPQVIDDCAYGKALGVQMRFISPYGDIESRYLNVLLPYIILFTLAAPRQMKSNFDVYMYPFIVKASCKGIFACEMGVISRLEVIRGGSQEVEWTADGHPTAIDVQIEITPLHSKLMQSKNDGLMIKNAGLQHYLGSICGVDMTLSTKQIMLETAKMLLDPTGHSGMLQTGFDNFFRRIDKGIQDRLSICDIVRSLGIFQD